MEEDREVFIILRRPFFATSRALIDAANGDLTMGVHEKEVTFKILRAIKYPTNVDDCL